MCLFDSVGLNELLVRIMCCIFLSFSMDYGDMCACSAHVTFTVLGLADFGVCVPTYLYFKAKTKRKPCFTIYVNIYIL